MNHQAISPGFKSTDAGPIPNDWTVKKIGNFLPFLNGKAHESFVSPSGSYVVVNSRFISTDGSVRKLCTINLMPARVGDVLMVMSDLPNGRALAKCFLVDRPDYYAVNQRVCIFRARKDDPRYLRYALNRNPYFLAFDDGVQQTHLLNDPIKNCPVILPPVPEQKGIAEALSDVEAWIGSLERLIEKKQGLKEGAAQALLTGEVRLPGIKNLPWVNLTIGDVSDVNPESLGAGTRPSYEFNYIALEDVDRGVLHNTSRQHYVSAPSRARRVLRDGDVLVSTVRPNLKSHLLYRKQVRDAVCSTGFTVVRCRSDRAIPEFLFNYIMSWEIDKQIERIIAGSSYPAISSGDVRGLQLRLPTVDEQRAIATVLSDLDAEIASLEQTAAKARDIKQGMMQQLLTGRVRLVQREAAA